MLVVGETTLLTREHRQIVDAELAGRFGSMTPGQARGAAAGIGYRLDPEQAVRRARKAFGDRRVTLRPAPDTMTYLTALLPVASGVAAFAALSRSAAAAKAGGDPRSRGALMADEFLARMLGGRDIVADAAAAPATACPPTSTRERPARPGAASKRRRCAAGLDHRSRDPVEHLTDGLPDLPGRGVRRDPVGDDRPDAARRRREPAILSGYGPIPAALARHLVRGADDRTPRCGYGACSRTPTPAAHRRRHPAAPVRPRRAAVPDRAGPGVPHALVRSSDPACRPHPTPCARWSDRTRQRRGTLRRVQPDKGVSGWASIADLDGSIVTVTPTGHRYRSHPPEPPRSDPWDDEPTETELRRRTLRRLGAMTRRAA